MEVTSLLLENGADPNFRDNLDRVPLHRAPQGGNLVTEKKSLETARHLIDSGANVNVTDEDYRSPLHAAARSGNGDIAELLLQPGASLEVRI